VSEKCLIIGLGQIGMGYDIDLNPSQYVLSHARSFFLHPDFELIGGVDLDASKCSIFEDLYKSPAYTSLDQALRELSPSIIVISTPSGSHFSILENVLKFHEPLAFVCEKPLDNSLEKASRIVEICEEKNIQLYVNYMRRSEKSVIHIKDMIDKDIIEEPIKCVAWYSKGLRNNGSHLINLLEYWMGDLKSHKIINKNRCWDKTDPEPDFESTFEKGSAIFLSGWEEYFPHLSIEILSPSGRLSYYNGGNEIKWNCSNATLEMPRNEFLEKEGIEIENDFNRYQLNFANNLSLALKGKECNISNGIDALESLKNVYKIMEEIA